MENIKKKNIFLVIAMVIVFGCYIGLLTLVAPVIGTTYIITLVFSLVSIALFALILLVFLPKKSIEGYFYQEPSLRYGGLYIGVQLIAGFVLTILNADIQIVLIMELIVLGVFGGLTAYTAFAGLHAKDVNDNHKASVSNMKKIQGEAKAIMDATDDYEWKRLVKGVWEDINYAPPVTTEESERIENDISFELSILRGAVEKKNREEFDESARKIKQLLVARTK